MASASADMAAMTRATIATDTIGTGNAGNISLTVLGNLLIDGTGAFFLTGILSSSTPVAAGTNTAGNAGKVSVAAGSLSILNAGEISTHTTGAGLGGEITVIVGGDVALSSGAAISAETSGSGAGGTIALTAQGTLSMSGLTTSITASALIGSSGDAGAVSVTVIGAMGGGAAGDLLRRHP